MITIFISRELSENSPFFRLNKSKFNIYGSSLVEFQPLRADKIPEADWYFFYSKNGVKYFHQTFGEEFSRSLKNHPKIACMGYGTSEEFLSYFNFKPDFTGSGKPGNVANLFYGQLKPDDRVVFFTAEESLHSVGRLMPGNIEQHQIRIYRNSIKTNISIPPSDILIFTSPKNAEAYFKQFKANPHQKIISIGKSTALQLHSLGAEEVIIAVSPSEMAMYKAVKMVCHNF